MSYSWGAKSYYPFPTSAKCKLLTPTSVSQLTGSMSVCKSSQATCSINVDFMHLTFLHVSPPVRPLRGWGASVNCPERPRHARMSFNIRVHACALLSTIIPKPILTCSSLASYDRPRLSFQLQYSNKQGHSSRQPTTLPSKGFVGPEKETWPLIRWVAHTPPSPWGTLTAREGSPRCVIMSIPIRTSECVGSRF